MLFAPSPLTYSYTRSTHLNPSCARHNSTLGFAPSDRSLMGSFSCTAGAVATERTIDVAYRCMKPLVDRTKTERPITYGKLGNKIGEDPWNFTAPLDYIWE